MTTKPTTTIRRANVKSKFTTLANAYVHQNPKLSYEARGLLGTLLSLPPDWVLIPSQLEREGCKRDKLSRIIGELVKSGNIKKTDLRDSATGKYSGIEYIVYEIPPDTGLPDTVEPDTDEPYAVDQPLQTTYTDSFTKETGYKKTTTTKQIVKDAPPPSLEVFSEEGELEKFYRLYDKKRVDLVCSVAIDKKHPSGWAIRALEQKWNIESQIPPPKPKYDPDSDWDRFYHYLTTMQNLTEQEADKYIEEHDDERFHFNDYSYSKEYGFAAQVPQLEVNPKEYARYEKHLHDRLHSNKKVHTEEPVDFDENLPVE